MPILERRSTLTANNARNADVAEAMVKQITPIQQQRMISAFRVQGVAGLLYNRLTTGRVCSCKAANKILSSKTSQLDEHGNAKPGVIDDFLLGMQFGITEYGTGTTNNGAVNKATFDETGNGQTVEKEIRDPVVFDIGSYGLTDIACPICFGSSFVGGYQPFRGWRQVLVPTDFNTHSLIDPLTYELSPGTHTATITLPKGAVLVDSVQGYNGTKKIVTNPTIGNTLLQGLNILQFCDGLPHVIELTTTENFTHFEIQLGFSSESIYMELPKLPRSADLALLELTDPFSIILSPDIPSLTAQDVIKEQEYGKTLVVENVTPWSSRRKDLLGWECTVRACQPQELLIQLPQYRPTVQKSVRSALLDNKGIDSFTF